MFPSPRIIALFLILAIILSAGVWLYRSGGNGVRNAIERQNNEAATRADEGALDYDACRDAGRVSNFGAGKCAGPEARGRN